MPEFSKITDQRINDDEPTTEADPEVDCMCTPCMQAREAALADMAELDGKAAAELAEELNQATRMRERIERAATAPTHSTPTTEFGQLGAECSAKPLIEVIREHAELSTQGDRGDHSGARRRTREFLWLEINRRLDRIRNYADEPSGRVVRQMLEGRP